VKRYRVSREAEKDLEQIFAYWRESAGLHVADRLIDALVERFWLLGEYPECGRSCEDIREGVRCFPAGEYLIYYRKARRGIEIARIFRGSRDQRKDWKEGEG
jgi:toxin ParE1/3/4